MAAMVYKWLVLYSFFLLPGKEEASSVPARHPFYVSVTEIHHNNTDKTLEISSKIFADDLEQILEKNYKSTLDITTEKDKAQFDKFIPDYFAKNLLLVVDGKPVKFSFVGYEVDKESAHCYFQVDHVASVKKLDIQNSLLYDFIDSEINIMHVTVNGNRKSTKLAYPDKASSFSF